MKNGSIANFLADSRILIENAKSVPEVSGVLAGYGYDAKRMEEGSGLWAEADALRKKQTKEYGEQYGATAEVEHAWELGSSAYMKTLKVARIVFGDEPNAAAALRLYGPRKLSISGWIDQAATFYANLRSEAKLAEKMGKYGYTADKLDAEAALVEELRKKAQAQAKETGEAQAATAERDKKLEELDAWVSDLRAICRVAFYESPQELEKLGVLVVNAARPKKKAAATTARP
jgi:hypothetical protein